MPIYEYQCGECGKLKENFSTLKEYEEEISCPCGGVAKRIYSAFAFHGFEFSDWRREYLAHRDNYPDAESNIRYCEHATRKSRTDLTPTPKEKRVMVHGH